MYFAMELLQEQLLFLLRLVGYRLILILSTAVLTRLQVPSLDMPQEPILSTSRMPTIVSLHSLHKQSLSLLCFLRRLLKPMWRVLVHRQALSHYPRQLVEYHLILTLSTAALTRLQVL